jgi:hypothetical protein
MEGVLVMFEVLAHTHLGPGVFLALLLCTLMMLGSHGLVLSLQPMLPVGPCSKSLLPSAAPKPSGSPYPKHLVFEISKEAIIKKAELGRVHSCNPIYLGRQRFKASPGQIVHEILSQKYPTPK